MIQKKLLPVVNSKGSLRNGTPLKGGVFITEFSNFVNTLLVLPNNLLYNEQELLRRMAAGDTDAFTALYHHYWEALFITAVKALRSKEDAADVVQDVFLSLWNRRGEVSIEGSPEAYLQTSVRYKAIHYIEKNITRRDYLAMLTETQSTSLAASAETRLQLKQVQQAIHAAIEQMPPKMKEVYQLSRQENLTHKEIATRLGISDETVKKHIQHALQLIKTAIGKSSVSFAVLLAIINNN